MLNIPAQTCKKGRGEGREGEKEGKEGENEGDKQKYKKTKRRGTFFMSLLGATVSNFRLINDSLDLRSRRGIRCTLIEEHSHL